MGRAPAGAGREGCGCSSTRSTPRWATSPRRACGPRARSCNYGNFNTYVTTKDLTKQEGLIFRHLLRLILLTRGVRATHPAGPRPRTTWKAELKEIADKLTEICRAVDPTSTEETIKKAHAADVVEGEEHAKAVAATAPSSPRRPPSREEEDAFGAGIVE